VGTVRILYRAGTISVQTAVHPKCTLGALNMTEEEDYKFIPSARFSQHQTQHLCYSYSEQKTRFQEGQH